MHSWKGCLTEINESHILCDNQGNSYIGQFNHTWDSDQKESESPRSAHSPLPSGFRLTGVLI